MRHYVLLGDSWRSELMGEWTHRYPIIFLFLRESDRVPEMGGRVGLRLGAVLLQASQNVDQYYLHLLVRLAIVLGFAL